jgi:hypothetical protein
MIAIASGVHRWIKRDRGEKKECGEKGEVKRGELKVVSNEDVVRTLMRCRVVRAVEEERYNGLIGGERYGRKD